MIKKSLLFVLVCPSLLGQCQTLLGAAGKTALVGQVHVSYALGEPFVGTIGQNPIVTQGFLQPVRLVVASLEESEEYPLRVRVFPNPTQDRIVISDAPACRVEMVNLQGQTVYQANYSGPFSVSSLAAGQYVLHLYSSTGQKIHSSSIIKY